MVLRSNVVNIRIVRKEEVIMSKFQIFGFLLGIMRKVLLKHKINFIFKNKNIAQFC